MKQLIKKYTCILFILPLLAGCNKFTDVTPRGKVLPTTVADYEEFLNDVLLANAGQILPDFMSDDIQRTDAVVTATINSRMGKGYLWMPSIFNATEDDPEWNAPYNAIYYCNLVLSKIDGATNGADSTKERLKAEALVLRSYYLFTMANIYGQDYTAGNTDKNLAVPILTIPDMEAKTARAPVHDVYDRVITDLTAAINNTSFPDWGRNYVHPGKVGAMALLARVYFYMGDYANAAKWADNALQKRSALVDYNSYSFINPAKPYSGISNKTNPEVNPENLFSRTNSQSGVFTNFMINPDLQAILGTKDLRFVFNFTNLTTTGAVSPNPYPNYLNFAPNYSIGIPEMMLIKAEWMARNGDKNGSVSLLNTLRQKRFKPADYTDLAAATADEALLLVLQERRRELFYHGLRWFDLKRLNREDRFKKTLQRLYNGTTYTLEPNSPRYLVPIATKIISINPGMIQNDR